MRNANQAGPIAVRFATLAVAVALVFFPFFPVDAALLGVDPQCTGQVLDSHWVTVDCAPGYATAHDRVRVFLKAGTDPAKDWRLNLDQLNSIWFFEVGASNATKLIIDFYMDKNGAVADLYTDQDSDGIVSYTLQEDGKLFVESAIQNDRVTGKSRNLPVFHVVAPDGWWSRNGQVNFNLDIQVDGNVTATFLSTLYLNKISTDGVIDFIVRVRDLDHDGRPDYEWRDADLPFSESDAYYHTSIMVNTEDDELPLVGSIFWPYLGNDYKNIVKDYNQSPPPLEMNWDQGHIDFLGEFVASRSNPGSYFIYSFQRIKPGQVTLTDHENPFAFYNLSGIADGYPDLTIRSENYFASDWFFQSGHFSQPIVEIEYTWDQQHLPWPQKSWSYMVGLVGRHPIDSTISFPDFSVKSVPYEQFPYWVTNRSWDAATFVAVEKPPLWTSEHIYSWTVFRTPEGDLRNQYVTGEMEEEPLQNYQDIDIGLRGEYSFRLASQPYLYVSTVDHRLHLLDAQSGIWRIDAHHVIRYKNLQGGDYINGWTLWEDNRLVKTLYVAADYWLYNDDSGVEMAHADIPPALVTTLPPRNHEEWLQLSTKLKNLQPAFSPEDFAAMLRQAGEPGQRLSGVTIHDFRLTPAGFRYVLELRPDFKVEGSDGPDVAALRPGSYVVTYDGKFVVEPLTHAQPQVVPGSLRLSDPSPVELEPIQIEALFENKGLEDMANLRVQALVSGPGLSSAQVITETKVALFGGQTVPVHFDWTPPAPGEWQISIVWNSDDPRAAVISASQDATLKVDVAHRSPMEPETTWEISNVGQPITLVLLLAGLGLGAAVVVILSLRGAGKSG